MRDSVLARKKAGLVLMLAKALRTTPEKALGVLYRTDMNRMLSDGRFGLQLMCNRSLVRDILSELKTKNGNLEQRI